MHCGCNERSNGFNTLKNGVSNSCTFERLRDLCRESTLGTSHLDKKVEHGRVMCVHDASTWMTKSVYGDMVEMV